MHEQLLELLSGLGKPRICVVGDVMLDTYVWGRVERVSPEAPIPVLTVDRQEHRPGGAAGVAAMLYALGARPSIVGAVGDDEAAPELGRELHSIGVDTSGLVICPERPTTLKTRYLGYVQGAGRGTQQILRVDEEATHPLDEARSREVFNRVHSLSVGAELILIQDMAKGLFSQALLHDIIRLAAERGTPVVVDPVRGKDYSGYSGATCLLPNRLEAEAATGMDLTGLDQYRAAARKLLTELDLRAVVITLDREGMFYTTADGEERHVPTHPRGVLDVTGAGDMVAAALALAMAGGAPLPLAVELANAAAGMEVALQGAATVSRDDLLAELQAESSPALLKVKGHKELAVVLAERRRRGETIAFTNGVFDLLHLGHVELIRFSRAQADCLVVGINSDRSVRELKGAGRPINTQDIRASTLAAMPNVDNVVVFDEVSVLPLVQKVRPDVLCKGGDYGKTGVVGWQFVESYGGQVMLAPKVEGLSTTELIERIAENGANRDSQDT